MFFNLIEVPDKYLYFLSKNVSQDNYVTMHPSATRGQETIALLTLSSDNGGYVEGESSSFRITISDSNWSELSPSADPEMVEELEEDQPEDLQTLTFDDLLSFAFQVAKGMEFLSSKNVRDGETVERF